MEEYNCNSVEQSMSVDDSINLILSCLESGGYDESYVCMPSKINVYKANFAVETMTEYQLDLQSVEIIDSFQTISERQWDSEWESWTIFKFDNGYGLASNTGWEDPTFSTQSSVLDLHLSHDMDAFDKTCLTNEIRDKAVNFYIEKDLLMR